MLLAVVITLQVFAKDGFSFITITGPGIAGEVRTTDPRLTSDFITFADFYRDKVEAPADAGEGYEINRYYIDGKREVMLDRLHYYPEIGFVFYDSIVNGESEYDGEWYAANPAIKTVFEDALPAAANVKSQSDPPDKQVQPVAPGKQVKPVASVEPFRSGMPIATLSVLVILLLLASRLRKPSLQ